MTTQELFTRIDELEQKYTEFWKEICMMETPTEDKQRLDALGAFLKDFAGRLGFEICEHEEEHSGNALCFTMNPDASGVPVCASAAAGAVCAAAPAACEVSGSVLITGSSVPLALCV